MAKQITIKEISNLSGVSAGTVDRILHNRGRVSDKSRARVEAVLAEVGYKYNIHTSAVSLKKGFTISVLCPKYREGSYWYDIVKGIKNAHIEYSDIDISLVFYTYDQYDYNSSEKTYNKVRTKPGDAVIIGGTFESATKQLCVDLDKKGVPYNFVDCDFDGCNNVGSFAADQFSCGKSLASLLDKMCPPDTQILIVQGERKGIDGLNSLNSEKRESGFRKYFKDKGQSDRLLSFKFFSKGSDTGKHKFIELISSNDNIHGIAVFNSTGHIASNLLKEAGIEGRVVGSFDLTAENRRCLMDGSLSFLLCQHPQKQGFEALKNMIAFLLYRQRIPKETMPVIPIEIIIKELL